MILCRRCGDFNTPLIYDVGSGGAATVHTVDDFLSLGRWGPKQMIPSMVTLFPMLLLGCFVYGGAVVFVLEPIFFDAHLKTEWFANDTAVGEAAITGASMGFFLAWGIGALLMGGFADRYGRRTSVLLCVLAMTLLSTGCAVAPSFGVWAACRALLGAPVGAGGTSSFLLVVEWAPPSDNALLTCLLMVIWSCIAVYFAGAMALTHSWQWDWRAQQLLLSCQMACALFVLPFVYESPRFHIAHGRTRRAEELLRAACARWRIPVPEGSELHAHDAWHDGTGSSAIRVADAVDEVIKVPMRVYDRPAADQYHDEVMQTPVADAGPVGSVAPPFASADAAAHPTSVADAEESPADALGRQADAERHAKSGSSLTDPAIMYRLVLVGVNWLAVSLLYYGLDFAVAACTGECNIYVHAATTSLVDLPGYLIGSLLADTRLGRRLTAAISLIMGGGCLLLTAVGNATLPVTAAATTAQALTLVGKLCAASAFIQAYLFPAELFPIALRGAALGVGNIFARTGTMMAPLAATAAPIVVQLGLGSLSLVAGALTLLLPSGEPGSAAPARASSQNQGG